MDDNSNTEHRPGKSFDLDAKWCTPCSCGLRFTAGTPSLAHLRWKKHAEAQTPRAKVAPVDTPPARIRQCGCGCGEPLAPRAGGLFRSGHDARFKSILARAHSLAQAVRHPATGEPTEPLVVADWLDERRGSGTFWRDKVAAGLKPVPERKPRTAAPAEGGVLRGAARAEALMQALATRRPASGDLGVVTLRSGTSHGARVVRRNNEDSLHVCLLDGPEPGKQIVVPDSVFEKASR